MKKKVRGLPFFILFLSSLLVQSENQAVKYLFTLSMLKVSHSLFLTIPQKKNNQKVLLSHRRGLTGLRRLQESFIIVNNHKQANLLAQSIKINNNK